MWLGLSGEFRARWSTQIHEEWQRNLLKNRPDLTRAQVDRTAELMDLAIPDALVTGHEDLIAGLSLPDENDRHVLAAAIRSSASVIVTFNEKDFPKEVLSPFGIEARHPDAFVDELFDLAPAAVIHAAQQQRKQLRHPPMDAERFIEILLKQGLVQTCKALAMYRAIL
jgi:PIN domain